MSDEKIYTNSQVEQVKYEIREDINVLQNKIKNIEFVTETIKVKDVRYSNSLQFIVKIKLAYHIEGHSNEFPNENLYVYPVIYNSDIGSNHENAFYLFVPMRPQGIVELTDDDTLKVSYMVEKNLE